MNSFPKRLKMCMNIDRLAELIGEPARRLHTARSRNDQVATSFKLWVRDLLDSVDAALADIQGALLDKAETYADLLMPGFTHLRDSATHNIWLPPVGLCRNVGPGPRTI